MLYYIYLQINNQKQMHQAAGIILQHNNQCTNIIYWGFLFVLWDNGSYNQRSTVFGRAYLSLMVVFLSLYVWLYLPLSYGCLSVSYVCMVVSIFYGCLFQLCMYGCLPISYGLPSSVCRVMSVYLLRLSSQLCMYGCVYLSLMLVFLALYYNCVCIHLE